MTTIELFEIQEGELVNEDAYAEAAYLSTDEFEDIYDWLEAHEMLDSIPDGIYKVVAYHCVEQKEEADKLIGFTKTEWIPAKEGWGYSAAHKTIEFKDGKPLGDLEGLLLEAHARSGYWGTFFEGIEVDDDMIKVHVGS